jgi:hypothetical protein
MTSIEGFREEPEVSSRPRVVHSSTLLRRLVPSPSKHQPMTAGRNYNGSAPGSIPTAARIQLGLLVVLVSSLFIDVPRDVEGKRVHIPDDLSDVVDIPDPGGEEGDARWEEWGKGIKKHAEIKPLDPENKEAGAYQYTRSHLRST